MAGALLGGGPSARAQPAPARPAPDGEVPAFRPCSGQVTRAEQDAAKGLFAAGRQAYEEGEYRRAIRYWRDAFDLDCNAVVMLRNLANAYERARNLRGAIVSLETYLARKPDADDVSTVRRRIENLRRELEASKGLEASAPAPPLTAPPTASAPPPASAGASSAIGASVPVSPKGPGPWPWVLTGAGGLALAAGVYFYIDGSSSVSDARERLADARQRCSNDAMPCDQQEAQQQLSLQQRAVEDGNDGRTRQKIGGGLMGGGAAAVAGGLAWYFLAAPKRPASTGGAGFWLMPALAPGYGGVGAVGRF